MGRRDFRADFHEAETRAEVLAGDAFLPWSLLSPVFQGLREHEEGARSTGPPNSSIA